MFWWLVILACTFNTSPFRDITFDSKASFADNVLVKLGISNKIRDFSW